MVVQQPGPATRLIVVAWLVAGIGLATVAALADPSSLLISLGLAAPYGAVGALLALRRAGNPIGWLFLGVMAIWAISVSSDALGGTSVQAGGAMPDGLAVWLIWAASWIYLALFALLFALTLVFPSGHLPGGRLGLLAKASLAIPIVGLVATAFGPHLAGIYSPESVGRTLANPAALLPVPDGIWVVFYLLTVGLLIAGVISLVMRLGRSSGIERQQLKWFVASLVLTAILVAVAVAFVLASPEVGSSPWLIALLGYVSIPFAVGVAVLRYRLYEIDVVIRRTLVYVPLTALLAALYSAAVGILQRVFQAATGNSSDGAIVLGTLLIVGAFTPIRNELQGRVDRGFRDHHDLERRLSTFTSLLEHSVARPDPARTLRELLAVITVHGPIAGGRAYLGRGESERLVGSAGDVATTAAPPVSIPIMATDPPSDVVGRLELQARNGQALRPSDLEAIGAAAARVAAALEC